MRITETTQFKAEKVSNRQLRVLYVFSTMYVCFGILVMPYFTLRLILDISTWKGSRISIHPALYHIMYMSKNVTSLINPLLYVGTCPQYQAALKAVMCGNMYLKRCMLFQRSRTGNTMNTTGGLDLVELRDMSPLSENTPCLSGRQAIRKRGSSTENVVSSY